MRNWSKLSIRTQLLYVAIMAVSLFSSILIVVNHLASENIIEANSQYSKDVVLQLKQNMNAYIEQTNRILVNIAYNPIVQDYLMETDMSQKVELQKKLDQFLINFKEIRGDILDIVLINDNKEEYRLESVQLEGRKTVSSVVPEALSKGGEVYYTALKSIELKQQTPGVNSLCFIIYTNVYSIGTENKVEMGLNAGKAMLVIDAEKFGELMGASIKGVKSDFFLTDRNDNIIATNTNYKPGDKFKLADEKSMGGVGENFKTSINGKSYSAYSDQVQNMKIKILGMVSQGEIFSDFKKTKEISWLVLSAALVVFAFAFTLIINNIVSPIKKMSSFINEIKSANIKALDKRIILTGNIEMSNLAHEFNNMMDEIKDLTGKLVEIDSRLYKSELMKKQSELAMLKSQINPHFLYNTLEAIRGMALAIGSDNISEMTKSLGLILRYSIKGGDFVSLSEEVKMLKSYIGIQMIRFQGRFHVEYEFTVESLNYSIPKMILQPIVENAIYHGLELKKSDGHLIIATSVDEAFNLIITVKDDGLGIEQDILDELQKELSTSSIEDFRYFNAGNSSIGITNVNSRIKLIFGEEYGISLNSEITKGTKVTLKFPVRGDAVV